MFDDVLHRLAISETNSGVSCGDGVAATGVEIRSMNPATDQSLPIVRAASVADYDRVVNRAAEVFRSWRLVPPPRRGEVVRQIGLALRTRKNDLGLLVTLETGKIRTEGEGEVQEMIDMCDFAVGLSRQLYGLTIASERARHRMIEQWQPLGPIGVISAFNFPVAVWAWNAMIGGGLRRHDGLEAVPSNAAYRYRRSTHRRRGRPSERLRGRFQPLRRRAGRHRRADAQGSTSSNDLRNRELPDGPTGRRSRRRPLSVEPSSSSEAITRSSSPRAPIWSWRSGRPRSRRSAQPVSDARPPVV